MQETETKIELTEPAFDKLLAHTTVLNQVEQLNVYYDCAGTIVQRSASLRIRYVNGTAPLLTLKLPIERNHGRRVSTEIEEPFTGWLPPRVLLPANMPAAFRARLPEICDTPLRRLGSMRNQRNTVRLPGGEQIELDRVTLPGGVLFFEAEIESDDPAVHVSALVAIREIVPDYRFSQRGKFQRFHEALRQRRS